MQMLTGRLTGVAHYADLLSLCHGLTGAYSTTTATHVCIKSLVCAPVNRVTQYDRLAVTVHPTASSYRTTRSRTYRHLPTLRKSMPLWRRPLRMPKLDDTRPADGRIKPFELLPLPPEIPLLLGAAGSGCLSGSGSCGGSYSMRSTS
ncbi:hypothetical protein JCM19037_1554 [Geomicrobium sp. JCM 19037]|nr:hypothetical protein JCM19037_1554 [Geomicrobium sp. JCM 19037]